MYRIEVYILRTIHASMRWYAPDEGGRKKPLDVGIRYFPTIALDCEATGRPWSIMFTTTLADSHGWSKIDFSLLADSDEAQHFESKLTPGVSFHLLEGMQIVGCGVVVQSNV